MAPAADPETETWTALYDADCGFCRATLAGLLALDLGRRVRPVAIQSPEGSTVLADLDPAARLASWHLVSPAGERFSAGAGAPPLLRLLAGGRVPAAVLAAAPRPTDRAYRWVAGHRTKLSRLLPSGAKARATGRIARHAAEAERRGRG
ncbi:MAG TPA: DCC1-like thiol-disulfide oxidoreductase family protein [Solirubrobacteraceae bacterium]|jgi:predicted DCC family thiol-disulfide oxidoreductase YuxK|nr:DCC1-like thiol-disulfide oxidoreductase family protein [Solirubrobacteraceae bacterium]